MSDKECPHGLTAPIACKGCKEDQDKRERDLAVDLRHSRQYIDALCAELAREREKVAALEILKNEFREGVKAYQDEVVELRATVKAMGEALKEAWEWVDRSAKFYKFQSPGNEFFPNREALEGCSARIGAALASLAPGAEPGELSPEYIAFKREQLGMIPEAEPAKPNPLFNPNAFEVNPDE